jgi:hypothetical protein
MTIGLLNGAVLIEFFIFAGWRERAHASRAPRTFRLERFSDSNADSAGLTDLTADNERWTFNEVTALPTVVGCAAGRPRPQSRPGRFSRESAGTMCVQTTRERSPANQSFALAQDSRNAKRSLENNWQGVGLAAG